MKSRTKNSAPARAGDNCLCAEGPRGKKAAAASSGRLDPALSKLTRCFLKFGPVPERNIDLITRTAGEILGTCVLYNRLEGDSLCTVSAWKAPAGMIKSEKTAGQACLDVIKGAENKVFTIRNLDKSPYAAGNPNIKKYKLKTYIGCPVRAGRETIGSLCAVFTSDAGISETEIKIISILAGALGVEEQRRISTDRLKAGEEKYRTIINSSQDITYAVSAEGRITYISRQVSKYGYTPHELIGRHILEFIHPDNRHTLSQVFAKAVRTGVTGPPMSYLLKKKDGSYFHAEQKSGVIKRDGKPVMISGIIRDVTERDLLRSRVEENEKTLQTLFDTAKDVIFIKDTRGRCVKANKAGASLFGMTPELMSGKTDAEIFSEGIAGEVLSQDKRVLKNGETLFVDNIRETPEGIRTFNVMKTPLKSANGEITGLLGIARDITVRKDLENKIRESEETLSRIFDTATDIIFIKDLNGRYIKLNRAGDKLFGTKRGELYGKTDFDVFSRRAAEESVKEDSEIVRSGKTLFLNTERNIAGRDYHFNVVKTPLKDASGKTIGILGIVRDITELKKIEAELIRVKAMEAVKQVAQPAAHDFNNVLAAINGYATLIMETLKAGNPVKPEIMQILNAVKRASDITARLQTYGSGTEKKTATTIKTTSPEGKKASKQ